MYLYNGTLLSKKKEQTTDKHDIRIKPLCWVKKTRPKSINTNYSENENIATKKARGAEGCSTQRQDGTF